MMEVKTKECTPSTKGADKSLPGLLLDLPAPNQVSRSEIVCPRLSQFYYKVYVILNECLSTCCLNLTVFSMLIYLHTGR